MSLIASLWQILTSAQRRRVLVAQIVSVAMAFSTVTGIAAIAPFFAVLGEPLLIDRNALLHWLYLQGGFSDKHAFIIALGLAFIAVTLLANLINVWGTVATNRLALRIGRELQLTLFQEYLSRSYLFHANTNSAALFNKVIYETTRVASGVLQNGLLLVTNLITALLIIVSVLVINPAISMAMLLALAGGYAVIYLAVRGQLLRVGQAHSLAWSERARIVSESFAAIREFLLLSDRRLFDMVFVRSSREVVDSIAKIHLIGQVPKHVMECIAVAALVGLALAPGAGATGRGAWLGHLTFIAFAAYRLLPTLQQIFACAVRIRADSAALAAIAPDLQRARSRKRLTPTREAILRDSGWNERPREHIAIKNASFAYSPAGPLALHCINMDIRSLSTVALVGVNGSGKTTLMDCIAGLLEPTSGELQIDGVTLDETNRAAWQAQIAYVPQTVFLLDASIAENIAFGTPFDSIDKSRLAQAAKSAQLDEFIAALPGGFGHRVGERGVKLSGGQRQRIGIARALYKQAPVILLDEAMSAVDGLTEAELVATLEGLRGRCTIILIAHRMSTVRWCDMIYQLEDGRITNSGTYTELAKKSERFRRIVGAA
jgi:ABC-type multidrug transport system fused ATPase/permease subunit